MNFFAKNLILFFTLILFLGLVFFGSYIISQATPTDDEAWKQQRLAEAESSERGIFTEGLTGECIAFGSCGKCDILRVIANVFRFAFEIVGIVAVLVLVFAGFTYIQSAGNEEGIGKAKTTMTAAVIGTFLVFAAWLIVNTIINFAGFSIGGSWWSPSC